MQNVELTDDELLLLDGKCSDKVQIEIESAKRRKSLGAVSELNEKQVAFLVRVRREAESQQKLDFRTDNIRGCEVCGNSAGYAKATRNSKNYRKGQPRYDRPLTIRGVELAYRFVRLQHYPTLGCCLKCWNELKPHVVDYLDGVAAEFPEAILGTKPLWKRVDVRKCSKCEWKGPETEMGMSPSLMHGRYFSTCPKCGIENKLMGKRYVDVVPNEYELIPQSFG